jgi:hypothetical protein
MLRASPAPSGGIDILATGFAGQTCRLLASSNLVTWFPIATNQVGADGTMLFHDNTAGGKSRFYRLAVP